MLSLLFEPRCKHVVYRQRHTHTHTHTLLPALFLLQEGQSVFAQLHGVVCQGCFMHLKTSKKSATNAFCLLLRTVSHEVSCGLITTHFQSLRILCDDMIAGFSPALMWAIDFQAADPALCHCLCPLLQDFHYTDYQFLFSDSQANRAFLPSVFCLW